MLGKLAVEAGMRVQWWVRLALVSAITGFVASGPPASYQLSANRPSDSAIPPVERMTFAATEFTEFAASQFDEQAVGIGEPFPAQIEVNDDGAFTPACMNAEGCPSVTTP